MANCPNSAIGHQKAKEVVVQYGRGARGNCSWTVICVCLCKHVKHFSVLCSFTAVISAHPIHSLDNPHHHFHSSSLASPARSHLYHPGSSWPIGTSMSLSDRANSTGERWGWSPRWKAFQKASAGCNGEDLPCLEQFGIFFQCYLFIITFLLLTQICFYKIQSIFFPYVLSA